MIRLIGTQDVTAETPLRSSDSVASLVTPHTGPGDGLAVRSYAPREEEAREHDGERAPPL